MKKLSYYVTALIFFIVFSLNASASKIVVIDNYDVRFRSGPTTSSSIITAYNKGYELSLLNASAGSGNGCNSVWYQVSNGTQTGYVCSEFAIIKEVSEEVVDPNKYKEYSEYLKELGFPDSYISSLITLHNAHPNWQFKVFKANVDFNKIVSVEYDGHSKGWSLIEDTGSYYDGYKSTDSWSYTYLTNTFSNNFTGGGTYWYAANKDTIAYYLDPRNFLNEKQVFMFETLSYNTAYHTKEGIEKMLNGTFMTGYADEENKKTYVDAFIDASNKYKVSPYVLISRVIQEVGAKGSTIVSGTFSGYEGYYNFYNIKAAGNSSYETIANGLKYAKEQGWNTKYKAIVGGASFLANSYISQGQDTLYLQKWDLFGPNYGNHQYMQNISAPSTESIKTYNGYNNVSLISSNFVFSIPVFNNMPSKTSLPNSGNPNNYLSSLSVNGSYLFDKATTKTSFDLNLDNSTTSVEIAASKVSNKATISGTGSVALSGTKQSIIITVTAANGAIRKYTINITRNNPTSAIDISEILRILNIKNDGNYIYGYALGTDITKIVKSITDKETKATVTYYDKNKNVKNSGIIASGDVIKIKTDREEKDYSMIVYGDVSGDGKITSADYIAIKNHIMDVKKLNDVEKVWADANKDGTVSSADYIAIKNHIMDVKKIAQ